MKKLFALLTLLALAGCAAHEGHPFDMSKVDQLTPGVSTEADAKALLGEPTSVSTNPQNNHQLLQWVYSHASIGNSAVRV